MITYRATLDVPRELVAFTARLLLARRRRPEIRADLLLAGGPRAGLVRDRTAAGALTRDHGVSPVTACRYAGQVITVLAAAAPNCRRLWGASWPKAWRS